MARALLTASGMQLIDVNVALGKISDSANEGDYRTVQQLARELSEELGRAASRDPLELGWARFYEIRSAYALGDWAGAWDALQRQDGHWALAEPNGSYLCSIAAELAQKLGKLDAVLSWGGRCLEIRRRAGNREGEAQCAQTLCVLLARLGEQGHSTTFARRLLEIARETGDGARLASALRFLLDAHKKGASSEIEALLVQALPELRREHEDGRSAAAIELIQAIQSAPWFEDALSPAERTARRRLAELARACQNGDADRVGALLDSGMEVDARDSFDRTPLIHAAFSGQLAVVELLLSRGAAVDAENLQRRTALVLAADQGYSGVVECLLRAGADPDHAGIFEQTALIVAGWQGHASTVSALLAGGAAAELRDQAGNTALTLTATEDQPEVIHRLLDGGARIDAPTRDGHTALMKAAMEGRERVLEVLLARGANPTLRDRHGMSAADWARQENHAALGRRLERAARLWRG